MDVIQNFGKEKEDIRTSIVENTRKTEDLRVLKSMVTRISALNTPRWKRDQNKKNS